MIIADTGFWVALLDKKDNYHQQANQAFKKYDEPLITTWCVITETCYLSSRNKTMTINTQLSEKLEVLNSLYQKGYHSELIERSLSKIIDLERSQAIKQASELQEKLQKYEAKYQRTSNDFYQQFMAGELGDSMDFTEWSIFYDMWQSVQSRLSILKPLEN